MPCQAHVVTCLVEACRAHVVACMPCQAHVVTCLVPMSWHVKPCRCMPCQDKVVVCLVKPMSLHALSSPCRGMLRRRCMRCQAHPCHALSCFQRLPGDKHTSCHGMASPASSIFFYASFKNPLSWPLHFMFHAMHVDEDKHNSCHAMSCLARCLALSCFQIL
jgi:hypothetical protein